MAKKTKTFIIAEAGVNHNGDMGIAKKLIDCAVRAGADAVKFQTFKAERLVLKAAKKAPYQLRTNGFKRSQFGMLKRLELGYDEFQKLKRYCDLRGIEFISTPYDIESVRFLNDIGVNRFKVASADLINKPLIEAVARTKKQIILSIGMATLGEVSRTITFLNTIANKNIVLLHCTTNYPASYGQVNMNVLRMLKDKFCLPIGYSDHTPGIEISIMAVSLGAEFIEKHFTLSHKMKGPDHSASLEPDELVKMIKAIRNVEEAFGSNKKKLTMEEKKNIFFMRRGIHAAKDIEKGQLIKESDIKITRPFDGIEPWFLDCLLSKKTKAVIKKDKPIRWEVLK